MDDRPFFLALNRTGGSGWRAGGLFFFEVVPASGPVRGGGSRVREGADECKAGLGKSGGPLFLEERGF